MTGYDGIEFKLETALASPQVKGILLDIHSGGGEVSGAFDLADKLAAVGQQKPVWAVADEHAFSGAYLLASQASRITTPRTGEVGSIGVIMMHSEMSRMLANEGVTVTLIKAGARKADMNPFEPLSDSTVAKLQAEVDATYQMFVGAVARGRGLTPVAVRDTAADVFNAPDSLKLGLIDAIQSANDTFTEFAAHLNAPARTISIPAPTPAGQQGVEQPSQQQESPMADEAKLSAAAAVEQPAADATRLERDRVLTIQTMTQPGEEALAADLIENGSSTAVAAQAFAQSRREKREASAAVRRNEAVHPLRTAAPSVAAEIDQNLPIEQRAKLEWDSNKNLHVEFGGSFPRYKAYRAAEERGDIARIKRGATKTAAPL
jgi:signal peptide peptidase SppA